MIRNSARIAVTATIAVVAATAASHAHPVSGAGAGFLHPMGGLDHVLAMLAVGLWAGMSGRAVRIAAPAAFAIAMIAGALLAMGGIALPGIEAGIAASLVVFGLLAAAALRLGPAAGAAIVGAFALFHGAAHGAEMAGASALTFIAGFTAATVVLQLTGVGLGVLAVRIRETAFVRAAGVATAAAGIAYAAF
jgi:urease accessory protein